METWIVKIETRSGEKIWSEENYRLGRAMHDLWKHQNVLNQAEKGLFTDRLTGKVQPVIDHLSKEKDDNGGYTRDMFGTIVERLAALEPDEEITVYLTA